MTDPATCDDIAQEIERLIGLLEVGPVPLDYNPSSTAARQIIADIRDAYSNFEDLLLELGEFCRAPVHPPQCPRIRGECEACKVAYLTLKKEANRRAEAAYRDWQQYLQNRADIMGQIDDIARRAWDREEQS